MIKKLFIFIFSFILIFSLNITNILAKQNTNIIQNNNEEKVKIILKFIDTDFSDTYEEEELCEIDLNLIREKGLENQISDAENKLEYYLPYLKENLDKHPSYIATTLINRRKSQGNVPIYILTAKAGNLIVKDMTTNEEKTYPYNVNNPSNIGKPEVFYNYPKIDVDKYEYSFDKNGIKKLTYTTERKVIGDDDYDYSGDNPKAVDKHIYKWAKGENGLASISNANINIIKKFVGDEITEDEIKQAISFDDVGILKNKELITDFNTIKTDSKKNMDIKLKITFRDNSWKIYNIKLQVIEKFDDNTDSSSDNNTNNVPDNNSNTKPDDNSNTETDDNSNTKPDDNSNTKPDDNSNTKPDDNSNTKPDDNSNTKPDDNSNTKPDDNSNTKPDDNSNTGTDNNTNLPDNNSSNESNNSANKDNKSSNNTSQNNTGSGGSSSGTSSSGRTGGFTSSGGSISSKKNIQNKNIPSYVISNGYWININGKWQYRSDKDLKNQWAAIKNPYANQNQESFSWFKFDKDSNMLTGWIKDDNGKWYYLNSISDGTLGAMLTSWQWIKDPVDGKEKCYYFNPNSDGTRGMLLTNTTTNDGYQLNEKGEWVVSGNPQTK